MKMFDCSDEGSFAENRPPSERLASFTKALWDGLVPASGACEAVQGELVRARERLASEYLRNGMANYFARGGPEETLAHNMYGGLLLFVLDTMNANHGGALSEEDVAYFSEVRRDIEPQWLRGLRSDELYYKGEEAELTEAEQKELALLDEQPRGPHWDQLFERAERCIANWCLANTALIDRQGRAVSIRGVSDIMHIFEPPPLAAPCALCQGKGWLAPKTPSDFPSRCPCKQP